MGNFKKYTQANREAENEPMPHHKKAKGDKRDNAFATPGFSEYPDDISALHGKDQEHGPDIALSYILIAEKE